MASTALSNIVDKSQIASYITATFPDNLPFVQYGAATFDSGSLVGNGGAFFTIPTFAPYTTDAEVNDGSASTPAAQTSYSDIAPVLHRKKVMGVDSVVKSALGKGDANAVNEQIASQSVEYWALQANNALVRVLGALFDPSNGVLRTTHKNLIGVGSDDAVPASFNAIVDTAVLHGDQFKDIAAMVCHSKVWGNLMKEAGSKASFMPFGNDFIPVYAGIPVVLSDNVFTSGSGTYKLYHTYLIRPDALYVGIQRDINTVVGTDATVPRDIIAQEFDFVAMVRGNKWNSVTANPTDAELATATNYTKTAPANKLIGVTCLCSNAV